MDEKGRVLWSNEAFQQTVGNVRTRNMQISQFLPAISKEKLPTEEMEEAVDIPLTHEEKEYRARVSRLAFQHIFGLPDEEEAEMIKLIYDKFLHTDKGLAGVAKWLNDNGYRKKLRQNGTVDRFSSSFVKGIIDNPVYMGKIAYGRDENNRPIEWYILGKDSGVAGDNIMIFPKYNLEFLI